MPPGLPNFNPVLNPSRTWNGDGMAEGEEFAPQEKHLITLLENEGPKDNNDPQYTKVPTTKADALELWFQRIHSGSELQKILKLGECLENCSVLKVVQIIPEIKQWINRLDDHKD